MTYNVFSGTLDPTQSFSRNTLHTDTQTDTGRQTDRHIHKHTRLFG